MALLLPLPLLLVGAARAVEGLEEARFFPVDLVLRGIIAEAERDFVRSPTLERTGGARQRTGRHVTVPPAGPNPNRSPNHTSGVPNPGNFGKITGPLFPQGWARSLVKYLRTKL